MKIDMGDADEGVGMTGNSMQGSMVYAKLFGLVLHVGIAGGGSGCGAAAEKRFSDVFAS